MTSFLLSLLCVSQFVHYNHIPPCISLSLFIHSTHDWWILGLGLLLLAVYEYYVMLGPHIRALGGCSIYLGMELLHVDIRHDR